MSPGPHAGDAAIDEAPREESFISSRRIAANTVARMLGEIVAKLASVAFFIAIARELGQSAFGDFVFGLSLSTVVLFAAGFGTDELLARNIARERGLVHHMLANVLVLRSVLVVLLIGAVLGIVALGDYPFDTFVAVGLIATGVGIELLTSSLQAVFQAYERQRYTAVTLIVQRCSVAGIGIAVLIEGGDLVAVSAIFAGGAVIGLLAGVVLLQRRVARTRLRVDTRLWGTLAKAAAPLGIAALLFTVLLKLDAALLGFIRGSAEVGDYGAAFRLVEATMFLTWSMGGAMLPWFSRQEGEGSMPLWRAYELGLKAIAVTLLPIGIVYAMYADQLIDLIYGQQYDGAVVPLQLLGAMTVLYGVNAYASIVLIARDRAGDFARPAAIVLVQNIVFNLILMPHYGADAAAFNAVLSGLLLAAAALHAIRGITGPYSLWQATAAPVGAGAAMAGVILLGGFTILAGAAGLAAYVACFALIERMAFVEDFDLYARIVQAARGRGIGAEAVPHELGP